MEKALKLITRDDVIRSGACEDGVFKWAEEFADNLTAMPVNVALRICGESDKEYIRKAANLDGYGYGSGYGYGDGDGEGYGEGYGDGEGYGLGFGGDGLGYGDGYGYGAEGPP